jgi:ComF family protein
VIVPVPVSPWTYFKRGYNQSALLAEQVGKRLNVPVASRALTRRQTPSQTRLARKKRFENAAQSFVINARAALAGKRVLLVDDIVTTGATLGACARLLKSAGAAYVAAHALAREELKNA